MHKRKAIRDAITSLLINLPTTGLRVYTGRVHALHSEINNALLIYTTGESVHEKTLGPHSDLMRILYVSVEIFVRQSQNYEDDLDQIALEVEQVLGNEQTLGGLVLDLQLVGDRTEYHEFDTIVATKIMSYRCKYYTRNNDPSY